MIIKLPVLFAGSKGEKTLYTLFDTGSTYSCINEDLANEIGQVTKLANERLFSTASETHFIKVKETIQSDFYLNDVLLSDEFMVIPGLSEEAIIGVTTMQKWRIKLDFEHDTVIVDPKVAKLILKDIK
jgi:predicted aspartyl protease